MVKGEIKTKFKNLNPLIVLEQAIVTEINMSTLSWFVIRISESHLSITLFTVKIKERLHIVRNGIY